MTRDEERARLAGIRADLGPDFDRYEFELCEPGIEPSVQEEVERNGCWHLAGRKGLRHWCRNKPRKPPMTKQDAMLKVALAAGITVDLGRIAPERRKEVENFVVCLEALGLIKFDEPKTARQEAMERLMRTMTEVTTKTEPEFIGSLTGYGAACILDSLEMAGLKIVRAG